MPHTQTEKKKKVSIILLKTTKKNLKLVSKTDKKKNKKNAENIAGWKKFVFDSCNRFEVKMVEHFTLKRSS